MSKQIITGTVEKVFAKDKEEDQWGNKYFLSAKISDPKRGDTWVGFGGKKQPQINYKVGKEWKALQEGDAVEVVAETNAKGYLQAKSSDITVKETGNDRSNVISSGGSNRAGVHSSREDVKHSNYEVGMTVGHAITSAINILPAKEAKEEDKVYEQAAKIIRLSMKMKEDMRAGKFDKGVQESEIERKNEQQGQQHHQAEEDLNDPIPF